MFQRLWTFFGSLAVLAFALLASPQAVSQSAGAFKQKGFGKPTAEQREAVLREMQPLWKRVTDLADAGRLKEAEAAAKQAIARAIALTAPNRPTVSRGYGLLGYVYHLMGRFPAAEQ